MELVGSGFQTGVQDSASGASKLGAERVRLQLELSQGIDGGLQYVGRAAEKVDTVAVIIDAIQQVVVLIGAGSIGFEPPVGVQPSALRLPCVYAGRQARQEGVDRKSVV